MPLQTRVFLIKTAVTVRDCRAFLTTFRNVTRTITVDRCRRLATAMHVFRLLVWHQECTVQIEAGVLLQVTTQGFCCTRCCISTALRAATTRRQLDDGLTLTDCRITNAVKCLPPDNKPIGAEINTCNTFLANELDSLPDNSVVMALGGIAHRAIIKALGERQVEFKFAHAAIHDLGAFKLLDSYHCSRYNTNTRRLTEPMFEQIFVLARELLDK